VGFVDALEAQIKGGSQALADKLGINREADVGEESSAKIISGVKMQNIKKIPKISEVTFKLASELELDYILVPVIYKNCDDRGNCDWSKDINYYHIFKLLNGYDISVLPGFLTTSEKAEVKIDYGDKIKIVQAVNGVISFVLDKTPVIIEEN